MYKKIKKDFTCLEIWKYNAKKKNWNDIFMCEFFFCVQFSLI